MYPGNNNNNKDNNNNNNRPSPPLSSSPSNPQRHPSRQSYTPPFYPAPRSPHSHDSYPLQVGNVSLGQAHYPPSPPGPAMNAGTVYTQRPAYISPYSSPHGGPMQHQMYGYLPLPSRGLQSPPDGMIHPLHTQLYGASQPGTSHIPYIPGVSPESVVLEHHPPDTPTGQSSPQLRSPFTNDPTYNPLSYAQPPNAPPYGYVSRSFSQTGRPLYQAAAYIPAYSQSYYHESPTHDGAASWWYLPHSSSPGPSYNSSPGPQPQHSALLDYAAGQPMPQVESEPISRHAQDAERSEISPVGQLTDSHDLVAGTRGLSIQSPLLGPEESVLKSTAATTPARRAYHPNPPINRSQWVMWVGNVPSDSTHDELWRFFNRDKRFEVPSTEETPAPPVAQHGTGSTSEGGVVSVFLISRSNCAFVNFDTEGHLEAAVADFNGKALRPDDSRCPKLVCRVRHPDDDLKAGVGGQRGIGMHIKWIREKQRKNNPELTIQEQSSPPLTRADYSSSSDLSLGSSPGGPAKQSSASSGSYASTTSSFLVRYFPKRYFILKSLNEADLKLSIERGIWATQRHNEDILDQAFHTSKDVYLIFSANKSGEFFGYARMSGPIRPGERRVSWTARNESTMGLPVQAQFSQSVEPSIAEEESMKQGGSLPAVPLLSPSEHRMARSPEVLTPDEDATKRDLVPKRPPRAIERRPILHTDPEPAHGKLSYALNEREHGTLDPRNLYTPTLARSVPTVRTPLAEGTPKQQVEADEDGVLRKDTLVSQERQQPTFNPDIGTSVLVTSGPQQKDSWGIPFPIEWIRTDKLSFQRTRHLRNPWNHDREVKVSRDGTELEPSVGEALIAEWEKLRTLSPPPISEDL